MSTLGLNIQFFDNINLKLLVLKISFYRTGIIAFLILESLLAPGYSQTKTSTPGNEYMAVYIAAKEKFGTDPLLMNGIYYENPYYNSKGHPFLGDGEFYQGSVLFRNKKYDNVNLRYDIYNHQLIIEQSREDARSSVIIGDVRYDGVSISYDENRQMVIKQEKLKPRVMNLLANEFVAEFSFNGMLFKKLVFEDREPTFYQVISENPDVKCYCYWHKVRYKSHDDDDRSIFVFTEEKFKRYLLLNNELIVYRNNRSFLKAFRGESKNQIRAYMRSRQIKVNDAESYIVRDLIDFCQTSMSKEQL